MTTAVVSSRRRRLADANEEKTMNAGLWLDKFIKGQGDDAEKQRAELVRQVARVRTPQLYREWFERWRCALLDAGAELRQAKVAGRMAVGLGDDSVLEASVALHHTYGVPYIPGSALKGMAASFARQYLGEEWARGTDAYRTMFGDTTAAGCVAFFDAFPIPLGEADESFLKPDIMTVHHPTYYRGEDAPPADWDSPNPVPFLSAIGQYLVALAGPPQWVEAAFQILRHALEHLGVGAKTSSGYGRLKLESGQKAHHAGEDRADRLIQEIQGLRQAMVPGSIRGYADRLRTSDLSPMDKRRVAEAIVAKVREARLESKFRSQSWYEELVEILSVAELREVGHHDD